MTAFNRHAHLTEAAHPAVAEMIVSPGLRVSSPFGGIIELGFLLEIFLVVAILIGLLGN